MSFLEEARASSRAGLWIQAARPRTLTISVAPVLAAAAHAWSATGRLAWAPVLAALVASMAIQIATNLFNDAADGARGHDGPGRLGPPRVTALGLIPAREVTRAALVMAGLAALAGLVAIAYGGWPILVIGVLSLAAGWSYSNGPLPISATPLGEVFVVLFFGVAAVCGVVYLADPATVSATALVLGVALGLPAAATLTVNNHRDRAEDARNGRRTLAILIGARGAGRLYAALLGVCVVVVSVLAQREAGAAALVVAAPGGAATLVLARQFLATPIGRGLNALLARTALFQLLIAALYASVAIGARALA
jgi:1,4-dihydroxy-2-naphthoate octaprenyltransferase